MSRDSSNIDEDSCSKVRRPRALSFASRTVIAFLLIPLDKISSGENIEQVAPPVQPCYDSSKFNDHFSKSLMTTSDGIESLVGQREVEFHSFTCLSSANQAGDSINHARGNQNETLLKTDQHYLPGTTYWINEYLHVSMKSMSSVSIDLCG